MTIYSGQSIFFDGIIYKLQKMGGISVLYNEIFSRMEFGYAYMHEPELPYPWCRYLDVDVPSGVKLFHSTYYRLPKIKNIPIVTTVHDFVYERYMNGVKKVVHAKQKSRAVALSDVVVCVSESTKSDLLSFYGAKYEEKIRVINNGVSNDYRRLEDVTKTNQVLFVGARSGYKNFENTVKAISLIPDVVLRCAGGGLFTRAEANLLQKYLPGRYSHTGYISNQKLNFEYNRSACLLYPSLYEGFGIPVVEAMRAGCPVVAVNRSSIPEVAGDSALLMDVGDIDEIFCALQKILSDKVYADYLVDGGLQQSRRFSWDNSFLELKEVYDKLIN